MLVTTAGVVLVTTEGAVLVTIPTRTPRPVIWGWGGLVGIEHATTTHELEHAGDEDESSVGKRLRIKDVRTRTGGGVVT